jgi:murein DD-endopeptidase MepM/ murein hydrolase activator NlpD
VHARYARVRSRPGSWRRQAALLTIVLLVGMAFGASAVTAPSAFASHTPLVYPVTGTVGGNFGVCRDGCSRLHQGYDFHAPVGDPVYASYAGTVDGVLTTMACPDESPTSGNFVTIDHDNGYQTAYMHLEDVWVTNGQTIRKGQQIGTIGITGNACQTPSHLHWEIRLNGSGMGYDLNDEIQTNDQVTAGFPIAFHFDLSGAAESPMGAPDAVPNAAGGLQVFARFSGGPIRYIRQGSPGGSWGSWTQIGTKKFAADPVAGQNADGRIEVFVRGIDNKLWHAWETSSGLWSSWDSLEGSIQGDPAPILNGQGGLEVFVRGTDNQLKHIKQTSPGGGWGGWTTRASLNLTSAPDPARNGDGRLEVFARGSDNALWRIWQMPSTFAWRTSWVSMGGSLGSKPEAIRNSGNILEVVARGFSGGLLHAKQTSVGGSWTALTNLGGSITSAPAMVLNEDGRPEVFARTGLDMSHKWITTSGGWSAWDSLGGNLNSPPSARRSEDGRLLVFALGRNAQIQFARQTSPGGGWESWFNLN